MIWSTALVEKYSAYLLSAWAIGFCCGYIQKVFIQFSDKLR